MDFKQYLEQIKGWNEQQIQERRSALEPEIKAADEARLAELDQEITAMDARSAELAQQAKLDQRRQDMAAVVSGAGAVLGNGAQAQIETRNLKSVLSSEEYENAYARYIQTGDAVECRALLTDLVESGTVPIPTYIADRIETAWDKSVIVGRLRRVTSDGPMKFPFELSAHDAVIHKEGADAPAEEVLTLGDVLVSPEYIKKWITISDTALKLKGRVFLDYIYDEIENRILLKADAQFVSAIKAAPGESIESAVGVAALKPAALDPFVIFSALAELSADAARPVAIMHKQTFFNGFMSLKDTTGRPIYNVVVENGRPVYYLNGVEVLFSSELAPMTEIIVGDLDGGVMLTPDGAGVEFVTDPYTLAEQNKVKIVGKLLAGFGVVRPKFFVKVTVTPGV